MPRFFVTASQIENGKITISGDDAFHISRSLRMAVGEYITVCDMAKTEYDCVLESFGESVIAKIVSQRQCDTEPPFRATLYQALPKGDKLDSIIQKSVECGVSEVVLFESERCIVKSDPKSDAKKSERRNRIASEAAKQCGRGCLPQVRGTLRFAKAVEEASRATLPLFCYEGDETLPLRKAVKEKIQALKDNNDLTVSIVIGPEGGFSKKEAELAISAGMIPTGLGKRILRTETAAAFALAALVYEFELG